MLAGPAKRRAPEELSHPTHPMRDRSRLLPMRRVLAHLRPELLQRGCCEKLLAQKDSLWKQHLAPDPHSVSGRGCDTTSLRPQGGRGSFFASFREMNGVTLQVWATPAADSWDGGEGRVRAGEEGTPRS